MRKDLPAAGNRHQTDPLILQKYTTQGPRYTSYPPVPFWETGSFDRGTWETELISLKDKWSEGVSLYIHLPYCESLCTFCACHKRITTNHAVEESYIASVLKEWQLYLNLMPAKPLIRELHVGGGTPSFFSPQNLGILIRGILETTMVADEPLFSFEGHPANTTDEHLRVLYDLGFRRVSFGVQDYDPRVQEAIHRIQSIEQVEKVTNSARVIGYTSISHDLVFGLPFQTLGSISHTLIKTLELKPDRIAFYSYAHVPWLKGNGQRGFDENDLPSPAHKRILYDSGLSTLEKAGYRGVGMDHFALPHDELFAAMESGSLHRNFMGYTTAQSHVLIGLGVSSISETSGVFSQNIKDIETYKKCVDEGYFPVLKGHKLSSEDQVVKKQILDIMCRFETSWKECDLSGELKRQLMNKLGEFEKDGLIEFTETGVRVLEKGRPFVRNISMAFDRYLPAVDPDKKMFSMTV